MSFADENSVDLSGQEVQIDDFSDSTIDKSVSTTTTNKSVATTSIAASDDDDNDQRMVLLLSNDEPPVEISAAYSVMRWCKTIENAVADQQASKNDAFAPIPCCYPAFILQRIVDFCQHHAPLGSFANYLNDPKRNRKCLPLTPDSTDPLSDFDREFVNVDIETLCSIGMAAIYLDCPLLHAELCKSLAARIHETIEQAPKDATKEEVVEMLRAVLHVENDWAEGELDAVKADPQYSWMFSDLK
jgi:hypothetical protein